MSNRDATGAKLSMAALTVALGWTAAAPAYAADQVDPAVPQSAEAPTPIGRIFEPAFFATFAPTTAADMIRNVPGFTLRRPNQQRGFGQSNENVIINGRRVSGKSNSAIDALDRIAADAVVRIEILEGASLSIPGLSGQVANVVTRPMGLSGRFEWNPQFRDDTKPSLDRGEASVTGEAGAFTYTLGLHSFGGNGTGEGYESVTDGAASLLDLRLEKSRGGGRRKGGSGTVTWLGAAGQVLNVNGSFDFPDFGDFEQSQRSGPNQVDRVRFFNSSFQGKEGELGADYEFPAAGGSLKLIGLQRFDNSEGYSRVDQIYADARPVEAERYLTETETAESIVRAEYAFPPGLGGNWQAALEGAYNTLNRRALYEQAAASGAFTPGTPTFTEVKETRGDASLTYSRELAPGLDIQASLAGEYSEISQAGANGLTREFVRPKGLVSVAWKATETLDVNYKLERRVGQLDFGDFASTNNLSDDIRTAGNEELVPEQEWINTLDLSQRFGAWGAVTFKLFHMAIEDAVDRIPIYRCDGVRIETRQACTSGILTRSEGVGNVDSAERVGAILTGTINFDPIGIEGAKFDFDIKSRYSKLDDPVTGESRQISGNRVSEIEVGFRHDVPGSDWAYGANFEKNLQSPNVSVFQRSQQRVTPGYTAYFVEHKDLAGLKARLSVSPRGPVESLTREVYLNGRDQPLSYIEDRDYKFAPIYRLSVSGSF